MSTVVLGGAVGSVGFAAVGSERAAAPADVTRSVSAATLDAEILVPDPATRATPAPQVTPGTTVEPDVAGYPVPADSGEGRRVVFSQSEQRVWLIDAADQVERTYPVSGSVYDNLFPGTYEVFSRSRHATAYNYTSTMEYFVRFTYGTGGSAIGFHDIPKADGELVQEVDELGVPLSDGCIRQKRSDAIALWEFADIGTTVVVTG